MNKLGIYCIVYAISLHGAALAGELAGTMPSSQVVSNASSGSLGHLKKCQDFAAANPDIAKDIITSPGDREIKMGLRQTAAKCGSAWMASFKDTLNMLIVEPAKFMAKSAELQKKVIEDCDKSAKCKRDLFETATGRPPTESEEEALAKTMGFAKLDVLYRNASARHRSTGMQNQREREKLEAQKMSQGRPYDDMTLQRSDDGKNPIWGSIGAWYEREKEKISCLKSEAYVDYICYGIGLVVDPTLALGVAFKIPRIQKIARATIGSLKYIRGAKAAEETSQLSAEGKAFLARVKENPDLVDLKAMDQLPISDRQVIASEVLGRKLTSAQSQAIKEAHEIGAAEGRGYGTYTQGDISAKARTLEGADFSVTERRTLMEKGIAGNAPDRGHGLTMQFEQSGGSRAATADATASARPYMDGEAALNKGSTAQAQAYYREAAERAERNAKRTEARDAYIMADEIGQYAITFKRVDDIDAEIVRVSRMRQQMRELKDNPNVYNKPSDNYFRYVENVYTKALQQLKEERSLLLNP